MLEWLVSLAVISVVLMAIVWMLQDASGNKKNARFELADLYLNEEIQQVIVHQATQSMKVRDQHINTLRILSRRVARERETDWEADKLHCFRQQLETITYPEIAQEQLEKQSEELAQLTLENQQLRNELDNKKRKEGECA